MKQFRRFCHILYLIFDGACCILYGWQVYSWIRKGHWTRIPSQVLLPGTTASSMTTPSAPFGKAIDWLLHVELAWSLCVVAILFYGLRWWADRKTAASGGATP